MPPPGYIGKAAGQQKQIVGSMKKGGMVPKTGLYQLHEGEMVVPAHVVNRGPGAPPKLSAPKMPTPTRSRESSLEKLKRVRDEAMKK